MQKGRKKFARKMDKRNYEMDESCANQKRVETTSSGMPFDDNNESIEILYFNNFNYIRD